VNLDKRTGPHLTGDSYLTFFLLTWTGFSSRLGMHHERATRSSSTETSYAGRGCAMVTDKESVPWVNGGWDYRKLHAQIRR
jgi:hypothetical protein